MENFKIKKIKLKNNLTLDEQNKKIKDYNNREIIINQIDRIKSISDLNNNSIAIDLILNEFLTLSINYLCIALSENDIIKRLDIKNADDYIKKSLRDLVNKNILVENIDNYDNQKYYSINNEYFIKNNI